MRVQETIKTPSKVNYERSHLDRLDRIECILEQTGVRLNQVTLLSQQTTEQQQQLALSFDNLVSESQPTAV